MRVLIVDILLVMDESGSIDDLEFQQELAWADQLLKLFE